jgi:hypothetical protein
VDETDAAETARCGRTAECGFSGKIAVEKNVFGFAVKKLNFTIQNRQRRSNKWYNCQRIIIFELDCFSSSNLGGYHL